MSRADDCVLVAGAIRRLYATADLPWPPGSGTVVPVPLDTLIRSYNLEHSDVPGLSRAVAGEYLARWGVPRPELLADNTPLAGFLFANASGGYILVNQDDKLARRRFTAAHELGHYLLHFLPRLRAAHDKEMYLVQDDGSDTVRENEELIDDQELTLSDMERQANQFAAELLMPEAVCRAARERSRFTATGRLLEHHLSSNLLVSRGAVLWRLRSLNLSS